MSVPLSVVIPTLNEAAAIEPLLESLAPLRAFGAEIIVADGGSGDDTLGLARAGGATVLSTQAGRARQMNAGAAVATGGLLWFVHADSNVSPAVLGAIAAHANDPAVRWGRFDIRLDDPGFVYAVIARLINLRSRLTSIATGDQGIFVRRQLFNELEGYAAIPLMEDIELCRRLRRQARPECSRQPLTTSARRWRRHGILRTVLRMWLLRAGYFLGVHPERLARRYPTCPTPAD